MRWRGFSGRERASEGSPAQEAGRGRVVSSDYAPLEIESFEYAPVGRVMALARLSGRWRNIHPSEQLDLALQIDAADDQQRVPALPSAGSREWPRWQFGFPVPQATLQTEEATFTLRVGAQLTVPLPAPRPSTLEAWGIGDGQAPPPATKEDLDDRLQLLDDAKRALELALRSEDEQHGRSEATEPLQAQLAVERQARSRVEQEYRDAEDQRRSLASALGDAREARAEAEDKLRAALEERLVLESELSELRRGREDDARAHSTEAGEREALESQVAALESRVAEALSAQARAEGERDAALEQNQRLEADLAAEREQQESTARVGQEALESQLAEARSAQTQAEGERDAALDQNQRLEAELAAERERREEDSRRLEAELAAERERRGEQSQRLEAELSAERERRQEAVVRVEQEARRASELERTLRAALEREQAARERAERELTRRARAAEDERTTLGRRIEEVESQAQARTREFETALSELRTRQHSEQSAERRLRALVESWVGVERAENDERRAQEELTRAMFSAGDQAPESDERLQRIVAWEQSARYAAERARESFDRAWEEARDAVEPNPTQGAREPAPEVRPSS